MRITPIDGLRGYFLLQMMAVHIEWIGPKSFSYLNHHRFGFVEDAQGFVLLSGFVVALVYGGRLERLSFDAVRDGLWARARQLYVYNLLCLAVVFAAVLGPFGGRARMAEFSRIGDAPGLDAVLSLLLIDGPALVDILPMYICLMIVTPWILRALYADRYVSVIAVSVAVWIFAQTGLQPALGSLLDGAASLQGDGGLDFGLYFNRLSWQLLFVAGLVGGVMVRRGVLPLERLGEPKFRAVLYAALALSLMFFGIRVALAFDMPELTGSVLLEAGLDRTHFGILRLANFVANAYVVLYLLTAGRVSDGRIMRSAGRGLDAVLRLPPLVFLGQHSLQVYALHIVLVYVVSVLVPADGVGRASAAAILMACWAALYLPGLWKTRVMPRIAAARAG